MKKIILFCEGLWHKAGIERMTVDLANLLCHDFIVIIVSIDSLDKGLAYRINENIQIISLNSQFGKSIFSSNIKNIRKLRTILCSVQPFAIITVATPLVRVSSIASWRLNIKTIAWEHFTMHAGSKIGAIYKVLSTYLVDKTVVLTKRDADNFRKAHSRNIYVIPNFTYIGNDSPSTLAFKNILAVGRHEDQKGFDLLLNAWARTNIPEWKLRIVGDGSKRHINEQLTKELSIAEKTEFAETTDRISEEFQKASCFILSSRYEGMVLVLIEAKMMGLPCISFDCPNGPKEIIRDGIDGVLVPSEDINALAKAMQKYLSAPKILKTMGQNARSDAMNRFSPDAAKSQWLKLINS